MPSPNAKPFLKWAGGKRKLFELYLPYFPANFKQYFEPFIGGGAILFSLFEHHPEMQATIIDINQELINAYNMVKTNVEDLIVSLSHHKQNHCKDYFYKVRAWDRDPSYYAGISDIERAARLIYLNKTCFNGLFRVNSQGYFNVPFGRYKNPHIYDSENLRNVSKMLQNVEVLNASFDKVLDLAKKGDFVYFDPPYQPISSTANFTSYTSENFDETNQRRLREIFEILDQRGCYVVLSNSANKFIQDLYRDLKGILVKEILASRAINRDGTKRGKIPEILILGKTLSQYKD